MKNTFFIHSDSPRAINEATTQPDPARLSLAELRICFPARIVFVSNDVECFVLDNAPVIGVIVDLAESLLRLKKGEDLVEVVDFYGEYKLMFRRTGDLIECQNEFAGSSCQGKADLFRNQAKRWSDDSLTSIEDRFIAVGENPNYQRIKDQIALLWKNQGLL